MVPEPSESEYVTAHLDAVLVRLLSGTLDNAYWQSLYARAIWRVRHAVRIGGGRVPDLHRVAVILADPPKLEALMAALPADRDCGCVRDILLWYEQWLQPPWPRHHALAVRGFRTTAASTLTVCRRSGDPQPVRLGRRTGPWSDWTWEGLPSFLQQALVAERRELGYESPSPAGAPSRRSRTVETGVSAAVPSGRRGPGPGTSAQDRRLELLGDAVQEGKSALAAVRRVRDTLRREHRSRSLRTRAPLSSERALQARSRSVAADLLKAAVDLAGAVDLLGSDDQSVLRRAVQAARRRLPSL